MGLAYRAVWSSKGLSSTERCILLAIAHQCVGDSLSTPEPIPVRELANACELQPLWVSRRLRDLEEKLYVELLDNQCWRLITPGERKDVDRILPRSDIQRERKLCAHFLSARTKRFREFWAAYPRKDNRDRAYRRWAYLEMDQVANDVLADVRHRRMNDASWLAGMIPTPIRYMNDWRKK